MMKLGPNFKFILAFILVLSLLACKKDNKKNTIENIPVSLELQRFDREYNQSTVASFSDLKTKYPYFFPGTASDSIWITKKNDSLAQALYKEAQEVFGDFKEEYNAAEALFRNIKYYYPSFKEPKLVTLISNLDMESQVIYADTLLIVSLDTYLGKGKEYYANYPEYMQESFEKNHIIEDMAMAVAYEVSVHIPYRLFLERIIAIGKLKYAMQEFLPNKSEADILDYSQKELEWAISNEELIWKYFIEKEYFYSTDKELQKRFLDPAPFSKFYMTSDSESPGQIGAWLGLRVVQAYMDNNMVSLPEMMATPPTDIFNKSKYKPRR